MENTGNNAIDYNERKNFHNKIPTIFVPELINGTVNNLDITNEITFEAINDKGKIESCHGLKKFVTFKQNNKNIYIFDNHNHALYFWHLDYTNQKIQDNARLIHVDQHKDTRMPLRLPSASELKDLKNCHDYTQSCTNVGSFIQPALSTKLIQDLIIIDSEKTIDEFKIPDNTKTIILDIDIDFFSPDMNYIPYKKKMNLIQNLIPIANIVTIATSPFFIDQELAINTIRQIGF